MHTRLIAALALAIAPTIAFAATPQTSSVAPATSARVSTDGHSDAARIEACTAAANTMIDELEKGDPKGATADFDATMRANLDAQKLGGVWQQVHSQAGKLEGRGTPQNMLHEGMAVILLPLHFQKADLGAQVACDADGKVAGFFLRPAATPSAPAASN